MDYDFCAYNFNELKPNKLDIQLRNKGVKYLIAQFKSKNQSGKLLLKDDACLKVLRYLSNYSDIDELNDDEFKNHLQNDCIKIFLDLIIHLLSNLGDDFKLDFFRLKKNVPNANKIENLLMLTRLNGLLTNYSNNSISFVATLNTENKICLIQYFQIIYQIILKLNLTEPIFYDPYIKVLIAFLQTACDLLFLIFEINKNFYQKWLNSKNIKYLNEKFEQFAKIDQSFKHFYSKKIQFYLIDFKNNAALINNQFLNDEFKISKETLLNYQNSKDQIFRRQSLLIHLNRIKKCAVNLNLDDFNFVSFIVDLGNFEFFENTRNLSNLELLLKIYRNFSQKSDFFKCEFQQKNGLILISNLITHLKETNDSSNKIEKLLKMSYLILVLLAKKGNLFVEKWRPVLDQLLNVINSNLDENFTLIGQIIKIVYDYDVSEEFESLNDDFAIDYFNSALKEKESEKLFKTIKFRDSINYLTRSNFDQITEEKLKILIDFLTLHLKNGINNVISIFKNDEIKFTFADIKSLSYFLNLIQFSIKQVSRSEKFAHSLQLQTSFIQSMIDFLLKNKSILNKLESVNNKFLECLYKTLFVLMQKIYVCKNANSLIDWDNLEQIYDLVNASFKIENLILNASNLIGAQFKYDVLMKSDGLSLCVNLDEDEETKLKKYQISVDLLIKVNEPKLIVKDHNCFMAIHFLVYNSSFIDEVSETHLDGLVRFLVNSIDFFVHFLEHFKQQFNFSGPRYENQIYALKILSFLKCLVFILCDHSNYSLRFCRKFYEVNANNLDVLLRAVSSEFFRRNLLIPGRDRFKLSCFIFEIHSVAFTALHNLSRVASRFKHDWEQFDSINRLLDLLDKYKEVDEIYRATVYFTLANVCSDDDLIKFNNGFKHVVKFIVEKIEPLANLLEMNEDEKRITVNIDETDSEPVQVIQTEDGWHLVELLNPLFYFAKCDKTKSLIYEELKAKNILEKIVSNGNEVEQEYCFKLIYQLCFDAKIAKDIYENRKFYELIKFPNSRRSGLVKNRDGIIWVIDNKLQVNNKTKPAANLSDGKDGHVMISYNRESRSLCLKLKSELENAGFKVWIDVEDIHGSSLDAMASAVEKSLCIMVCMTEKYKESPNCRLEVEYVMQTRKPFVPLIMQKNYKPSGWLGLILGTKIFIDFTKYEFEECIKRLLKEIDAVAVNKQNEKEANNHDFKKLNVIGYNKSPVNEEEKKDQSKNAEIWSAQLVAEWFSEKKINSSLAQYFQNLNGADLQSVYRVFLKAPEFFFRKLNIELNEQVNLTDLAKFTRELDNLFA